MRFGKGSIGGPKLDKEKDPSSPFYTENDYSPHHLRFNIGDTFEFIRPYDSKKKRKKFKGISISIDKRTGKLEEFVLVWDLVDR